jgi:hypothetical protein
MRATRDHFSSQTAQRFPSRIGTDFLDTLEVTIDQPITLHLTGPRTGPLDDLITAGRRTHRSHTDGGPIDAGGAQRPEIAELGVGV